MDSKKTGLVIAACRAELAMTQKQLAEQLAPESERSVREIFRTFGLRLKRFRWLLIALGILLLIAAIALLLPWLNPDRVFLHTIWLRLRLIIP